jgi:hypothetical protein
LQNKYSKEIKVCAQFFFVKYLNPKKNIDIYFIERRAVCPPAQHIRKCLSAANSKTFHSVPFFLLKEKKKMGKKDIPQWLKSTRFQIFSMRTHPTHWD